jgi:hypothetical protein
MDKTGKTILNTGTKIYLTRGDDQIHIADIHENTIVVQRDPEVHLMRKWNAYGINAELVDSGIAENLVIQEPNRALMITISDLKAHGRYHKEEEQEAQYFIDLTKMSKL